MTVNFIFFNCVGRLRSGWRFCIFGTLFFALTTVLATLAKAIFDVFGKATEFTVSPRIGFISSSLVLLISAICAGWICAKGIEGLPFTSLGWSLRGRWWFDFGWGIAFGAGSLLLATGISALIGGVRFVVNPADFTEISQTILLSALVFALGAAAEEALFRGYPLQTLARARLAWVAILLTSLFFSLAHADNQNVTNFGLINTALAGIWFVVAYLKTRNLWFPFGVHWAWNWTMAAILGLPVSGITQITPQPILRGIDAGPNWLTGGQYGIEGGAACTIALVASTVLIWFAPFPKPTEEMLALTERENPVEKQNLEILSLTDDVQDFER